MLEQPSKFRVTARITSFHCAFRGVITMIRTQHNAWIHLLATCVVCATSWLVGIDRNDWCWMIVAIVSVWTAEALNTAFEFLADAATPEFHPLIERSKNVAAGAVLIASIGAVCIAALILAPHIFDRVFLR